MWQSTPVYSVNDELVFGLLREPLVPDPTDQIFVVSKPFENRLDKISTEVYGTPQLWWVIAIVNDIIDIDTGIVIGVRLKIPLQSRLASLRIFQE